MPPQLSSGVIQQINAGSDQAPLPLTLQVLSVKKILGAGAGASDRWR